MTLTNALLAILFVGAVITTDQIEIHRLKKRIEILEKRTAPLAQICREEDFYEAFFRLVCEEK